MTVANAAHRAVAVLRGGPWRLGFRVQGVERRGAGQDGPEAGRGAPTLTRRCTNDKTANSKQPAPRKRRSPDGVGPLAQAEGPRLEALCAHGDPHRDGRGVGDNEGDGG